MLGSTREINGSGNSSASSSITDCSNNPAGVVTGPLAPAFDYQKSANIREIKDAIRDAEAFGQCDHAMIGCFAFANVSVVPHCYHNTHKPMDVTIRTPLAGDRLDVVMATNVSGHDLRGRPAELEARAKADRYNIKVTYPDGTTETVNDIVSSGDLHTVIPFSIRNMQPGKTIIETWPNGSFGVRGYVEGRRLEINYQPPRYQR